MNNKNSRIPKIKNKQDKIFDWPPIEDIRAILNGDSEKMISIAETFVKDNLKDQSTASIRKIYSEVKRMKDYDKINLNLLRPKLAYVSARHKKLSSLTKLLDDSIKEIKGRESFQNFQRFFEAILAYFYKYGKE